ncbi:hypothetical protein [Nonomuraea sp. NPDC048826]|uniref:hypothetical protein n=1 Tax=Nonomuraea sp. NPDC048826 TaxID=3364347 RepID=UPI00371FDE02
MDEARAAARSAALNLLAIVRDVTGSLDAVRQVLSLQGVVNAAPDFTDHTHVIDAALAAVGRDAVELVAAWDGRVRVREAPLCSLLFYDASRPGTCGQHQGVPRPAPAVRLNAPPLPLPARRTSLRPALSRRTAGPP